MKKDIINRNHDFPFSATINRISYLLNPINSYFEYKREVAIIEYETEDLKQQSKIITKKIDTELKKSLDKNQKDFKKEMTRLKTIEKELKKGSKNQKSILKYIESLTEKLENPNITDSIKENMLQLIVLAHEQLDKERDISIERLNLMSNFDLNQKS